MAYERKEIDRKEVLTLLGRMYAHTATGKGKIQVLQGANEGNSMTGKADIIIGIDPDVKKSGVGLVNGKGSVEVFAFSFPELIEYLRLCTTMASSCVVVVEASWKISTNWHTGRGDSIRIAARKGKDAGRCHEVGRKIVECAQFYGLEVVEKLPLKKIWQGKDGKITDEEIKAFMPIQGRTNQEERDAALLAWDYAGLPIRLARPLKSRKQIKR